MYGRFMVQLPRCCGEILLEDVEVRLQHLGTARRSLGHADCGETRPHQKADIAGSKETTTAKLTSSSLDDL